MARLSLSFSAYLAKWPVRKTVLAALAMVPTTMIASCVVSTPDFRAPPQSPPFLLSETANPKLQEILVIEPMTTTQKQEFSAFVRSEDAGQPVQVRLYVDYGRPGTFGPFQESVPGGSLTASTIDDTTRLAKVTWKASPLTSPNACHTFTLVVSHEFVPETGCPVDSRDVSSLTWVAYVCDPDVSPCQPKLDSPDASKNCIFDSGKAPTFCPRTEGGTTSSSTGAGQ